MSYQDAQYLKLEYFLENCSGVPKIGMIDWLLFCLREMHF